MFRRGGMMEVDVRRGARTSACSVASPLDASAPRGSESRHECRRAWQALLVAVDGHAQDLVGAHGEDFALSRIVAA